MRAGVIRHGLFALLGVGLVLGQTGCFAPMDAHVTPVTTMEAPQIEQEREQPKQPGFSPKTYHTRYFLTVNRIGRFNLYSLVFQYDGPEWLFLDTVRDSGARTLETSKVDRDARFRVQENLTVPLTREYLDQAAAGSGLDLRFDGQRGNVPLTVPADYVKGFLAKVDELGAGKK